ncbi:mitochondrial alternative oxidase [Staphylotrichum tortipilum]|uniref:Alternative oxidase n=1 Tax=Staphylotrichum tortipilum TaxID=2831512 RepID=A0AAN6RUD7_9PEZI|nr:mitochondrial alternative oxidase [Staphylotrichum longicolle]
MAHHLRVLRQVPRVQGRTPVSRSKQSPFSHTQFTAASTLATQKSQVRQSTTVAIPQSPGLGLPTRTPAQPSVHLTWPHKGWDDKVVLEVVPSHREPRTLSDRIAWGMDFLTGMPPEPKPGSKKKVTHKAMSESQWLVRFVFLETVAGIPGAVAGGLRHLHSIRRFKLDQGWIKTLLEESYNERMHLLTFLEMYKPGRLMRLMVFATQGVFYNTMFVGYLLSPSFCHRLVGYLEDEAVGTYTKCLEEMDKGRLPQWTDPDFRIPDIAVKYWNMPEGKRTMKDLILYIRADEASHRGVNHTLGNLDQTLDPNPFIEEHADVSHMHLAAIKPAGLEREEVLEKYTR